MIWNFFKKKNEKGSSLLILLVAMVMTTAFGFSVYRLILSMQNYNFVKSSQTKYWFSAASLREIIGRPEFCIEIFKGETYLSVEEEIEFELDDINEDIFNIKDFFPEIAGEIEDTKFVLVPLPNLDPGKAEEDPIKTTMMADGPDVGKEYYTYKANLEVRLKVGDNMGFNYESLNIKIPLYLNVDPDNNEIYSCYTMNSQAYACEAMGGAWNPEEDNVDKMCNPDHTCRTYIVDKCPRVNQPSDECPVYAKKILIGELNPRNVEDYSGAGGVVRDAIKESIKDEITRGLNSIGVVDGGISSEVDDINDSYKKTDCPKRVPRYCCVGSPPNTACGNFCTKIVNRTCYVYPGVTCSEHFCETDPPLKADNYINPAKNKHRIDTIAEKVAQEVTSEVNPYAFGEKIHAVYDKDAASSDPSSCNEERSCADPDSCCTSDASSCACAEKAVMESTDQAGKDTELDFTDVDENKVKEIVEQEMNEAFAGLSGLHGTHKSEIVEVIKQKILDILEYGKTKKEVKKDAKNAIAGVIKAITGDGHVYDDRVCACYWCNEYRYPGP